MSNDRYKGGQRSKGSLEYQREEETSENQRRRKRKKRPKRRGHVVKGSEGKEASP